MSTATPNSRASLLSGLRTGGVRSTSAAVPHTAAPGGSFNVPRFASQHHTSVFPEEEDDQMAQGHAQNVFANHSAPRMPMTAAVDGPGFIQQQQRGMNPNSAPFNPSFLTQASAQAQNQAFQMQMMQLEIMKMQTIQAQQYQAQILAAQMQQQQQQAQPSPRRVSFNPPATAGPLQSSFDLRSATLSAQMRRATQSNAMDEQQVPMTAALGGRFGGRPVGARFASEEYDDTVPVPSTPHATTVISGGTSLGSPASNNVTPNGTPSKSDSASNWRRGGNNNSVLSGNNRSPSVKVTPPPAENPVATPSPVGKSRPQPLRFSVVASQPMPVVAIDNVEGDGQEIELEADASSGSSKSVGSNPATPPSSSSVEMPLSPREEASKKLYEGLGIGRPVSVVGEVQQLASVAGHRMASQPVRQPRGPPSGADELGPKNFATRIRRKAIGGLGMLMTSRERREVVEAY